MEPGTIVGGDYCIERELARGGMGTVYVARQKSTGRRRALKLLHTSLASDEVARRRFEQEARVGASIPSAHVVEVQAAGIDRTLGVPWLVMELLEGETLETRLERGPLSPEEMHVVFRQICHAMAAAHEAGVVHRDLKAENVFLSRRVTASSDTLEVKVLDFGIAKLGCASSGQFAIGTPFCMAPEQARRGPVGPAADVWALGLMAFQAITGCGFWRLEAKPARTSSIVAILQQVLVAPIPFASHRARELGVSHLLPGGFDEWFAACVERDPALRISSVTQAWNDLGDLLGRRRAVALRVQSGVRRVPIDGLARISAAEILGGTLPAPYASGGRKQT